MSRCPGERKDWTHWSGLIPSFPREGGEGQSRGLGVLYKICSNFLSCQEIGLQGGRDRVGEQGEGWLGSQTLGFTPCSLISLQAHSLTLVASQVGIVA